MKKINKTVSFIIVFLQTAMFCIAQPSPEDMLRPTSLQPIEPTTASLGRYGEYQMDYSSGQPDISIPLYEIKSGDLTVPIVLRYQGGGIKVQQEATWVGLGWDLFYGGQVTRVVQGFPDETEPSMANRPMTQSIRDYINTNSSQAFDTQLEIMSDGLHASYSYMPDEYYYNIGMESGKFIGKDVEALIPYKPLKIVRGIGGKWQITNSNGECFYLGNEETTQTQGDHALMPDYTSA
ncbi:hypothetical protein AGMMS50262_04080 [Bacteroidia bacterium]|nr:hypothetical protein AGMMS50262_04080 [Bacteroidia bacterium]